MDALKEEMLAQEFAKECNTASKLDAARKWLASKPEGAALVFSGLRSAGFVEAEGDTLVGTPWDQGTPRIFSRPSVCHREFLFR